MSNRIFASLLAAAVVLLMFVGGAAIDWARGFGEQQRHRVTCAADDIERAQRGEAQADGEVGHGCRVHSAKTEANAGGGA